MADDKLLAELRALRDRLEKSTLLIEECHRRISELVADNRQLRQVMRALLQDVTDWSTRQAAAKLLGMGIL